MHGSLLGWQHGYPMMRAEQPRHPLRKGKWTAEEEEYTEQVIRDFNDGLLNVPAGTTLRTYLSEKLNCDPMRITKKFAGSSCIGKRIFTPCPRTPANAERSRESAARLAELEAAFRAKLDSARPSRAQAAVAAAAAAVGRLQDQGMPFQMMKHPVGGVTRGAPTGNPRPGLPMAPMGNFSMGPFGPAMAAAAPGMPPLPPMIYGPGAMPQHRMPRVQSASSAAELTKDDHDACGLLMGFFNTVQRERSSGDLVALGKRKAEDGYASVDTDSEHSASPSMSGKRHRSAMPSVKSEPGTSRIALAEARTSRGKSSGSASDETTDDESASTCSTAGSVVTAGSGTKA